MKRFFIMLCSAFCSMSCSSQKINNSTVSSFDLQRYLGTWYEIAKFDHVFERDLQYATADYSLQSNGMVKVVNSGMKDGKKKVSEGKAKLTNTTGLLRVSFFGPFYSDYRIMMLTTDYKYALIGSKSDKYLWILSRTPQIPNEILQELLKEAQNRGYNIDNLIWVNQEEM